MFAGATLCGRPSRINIAVFVGAAPCGCPFQIRIDVNLRRATTGGRPYSCFDEITTEHRLELQKNQYILTENQGRAMKLIKSILSLVVFSLILSGCNQTNGQFQSPNAFGGSATPEVAQYHAINSKQVVLYFGDSKPARYRNIGFVGAERENILGFPRSPKQSDAELRRQAASIGANGVIDIFMGETETTGKAIFVY